MLALLFGFWAHALWNPTEDRVDQADAIVVLAYGQGRLQEGRRLAQEGAADILVISQSERTLERIADGRLTVVSPDELETQGPPDGPWIEECGAAYADYQVICFSPDPDSTAGEALAVDDLSREHGWDEVVLVTEQSHLGRAKRVFSQCANVDTLAVSSGNPGPLSRDIRRTFYELGAAFKEAVASPCR